jgi:hypothetical protein
VVVLAAGLAAAIAAGVIGCGGSSSGSFQTGSGRVGIMLTDQAGQFEQVLVTITSVQVHAPGGDWVTVATQQDVDAFIPQPINLLSLQNVEKLIGVGTLSPGLYTQMRLILAPTAEVVLTGGEHRALTVPSGAQTGLKMPNFTVPPNQIVFLLIDIKTDQIVARGGPDDGLILPPTAITVTTFTGPFGSLRGTVAPANSGAVVTAFFAGTSVPVGQVTINSAGTWEIDNLLAGQYYVTVAATGFEPFDSRPTLFDVVANQETDVPLVTLTPVPPSP